MFFERNIVNDECNNELQSKFVSDNVINISSRVLTQAEVSLLLISRGLKFCPTPIELDISSVKRDIKEFGRKLKCKAFFHSKIGMEQEGQTFRQFREKSAWCPTEVDPAIELYLSKFEERVLAIKGVFIIYTRGWYRRETNRKEKKTTTHPFDQPFFSLPNYCMTWIFILPNPISKLYKYFTYIHIYYYTS